MEGLNFLHHSVCLPLLEDLPVDLHMDLLTDEMGLGFFFFFFNIHLCASRGTEPHVALREYVHALCGNKCEHGT
jgi:hypothetical protein